ncbi:MAG: aldo/keto reductase [Spirochaetia bacterium]|nr:aldo/keto reductase [Spirochaetia bacterium]
MASVSGILYGKPVKIPERKIPSSGERIPVMGMGTWRTFDVDLNPSARKRLSSVLEIFHDLGGRMIDSSPMYGRSETVIGQLTGNQKRGYFYATKVWVSGEQNGINQMKQSFQKMKVKKIDLFQIHNLLDWKTHLKTLNSWKDSGKIRYTGITHYVPSAFPEIIKIIETQDIDFIQIPYSVFTDDAENYILPAAENTGTAVIVNRPFEGGSAFRRLSKHPLPPIASEIGASSWAQLLLKFILANPSVTCIIPATGNPVHMKENMLAAFGIIPDKNQKKLIKKAVISL